MHRMTHDALCAKLVIEQFMLQGILELEQDLCHHRLVMSDAQHHHVGYLTISVRGLQAFRTMQGQCLT